MVAQLAGLSVDSMGGWTRGKLDKGRWRATAGKRTAATIRRIGERSFNFPVMREREEGKVCVSVCGCAQKGGFVEPVLAVGC